MLFFVALISLQCFFVVGAPAQAEGAAYEELIPNYYSFSAPARVAVMGDTVAVFDAGNVVIFDGGKRTVFASGVEKCDKLCLSSSGVFLLSGVDEKAPKISAFALTGEKRDLLFPSEGVQDVAVSGDLLYTLSPLTWQVTAYRTEDASVVDSFAVPYMSFAFYFAVSGDTFWFLSPLGRVFSRVGGVFGGEESLQTGSNCIQTENGKLYYLDTAGNLCVYGEDRPLVKKGKGDSAFASASDFAVGGGKVVVADESNAAIKIFDATTDEKCLLMIGSYGSDLKRLKDPVALSVKGDRIAVADASRASIFSDSGVHSLVGHAISSVTDVVVAGDRYYLADGGTLWEYNDKFVASASYSVGKGECRYVAAAPDGTIYASSGKEIYTKKEGESAFSLFLTLTREIEGLNVGIGGKTLYVMTGNALFAYSRDGILLRTTTTNEAVKGFAVDYRGNVFFLSEENEVLKYARTLEGYSAAPVRYPLSAEYKEYRDIVLDGEGKTYLIADHNVLIYPKTAFGAFVAEDSDFKDEEPSVSPLFVCEAAKDTIAYVAPDNFEDISSVSKGKRFMCYATVTYLGDKYLRVETDKGTAYLPQADVKIFSEGTAPLKKARCLLSAIGSNAVGVNLYAEPSHLAVEAEAEPLFASLGKSEVFEVDSLVATDDDGKDVWGFYRVTYQGKTAYVLTDEVVSVDDEPEKAPAKYKARVKSEALGKTVKVYKEASTQSEAVARLTDGTEIYTLEPIDKNKEFIQVLYKGEVCYVLSSQIGQGGLSGGQILAIVLSVVAVVGSVLTILILRANKRHKRFHKE